MASTLTATSVNAVATNGTHTVFVIDLLLKPAFDGPLLTQSIDAILAFGTSLLMQSGANKLSILGSSTVKNTVLYLDQLVDEEATVNGAQSGAQMERYALLTSTFRRNLRSWMQECGEQAAEHAIKVSMLSGAVSQGLCLINRHKADFAHSRLIIFSLGSDKTDRFSSQYMKLINCFFAAQKSDILIDACTILLTREKEDSATPLSASMEDRFSASILQQGCQTTGGRYIRIHKVSTLLEHLFWCFSPSPEERSRLVLPPKLRISPPAACFCHRKVLEIGYVCSVCVSIFCQYLPFCSTCHSNVFVNNLKKIAHLKSVQGGEEKAA